MILIHSILLFEEGKSQTNGVKKEQRFIKQRGKEKKSPHSGEVSEKLSPRSDVV
jgi:hypothetical protein